MVKSAVFGLRRDLSISLTSSVKLKPSLNTKSLLSWNHNPFSCFIHFSGKMWPCRDKQGLLQCPRSKTASWLLLCVKEILYSNGRTLKTHFRVFPTQWPCCECGHKHLQSLTWSWWHLTEMGHHFSCQQSSSVLVQNSAVCQQVGTKICTSAAEIVLLREGQRVS